MLKGYIESATGASKRLGMVVMARDLMRSDPASLRQGYTAANAYIAVIEQAGREGIELTAGDKAALANALVVDGERLAGAIRQ